jgi:hypothetical protein
MRTSITEALVKAAGSGFVRDDKVIGFGLRTTTSGFKSFIVEARVSGRVRRFTIGPADRWTVADARNEARQILAGMNKGRDPLIARRAGRERSRTLVGRLSRSATGEGDDSGEVPRRASSHPARLAQEANCRNQPCDGSRAL